MKVIERFKPPTYTEFIMEDSRMYARAYRETNSDFNSCDEEHSWEKCSDFLWRSTVDGKSQRQILSDIGVNPDDYLEASPVTFPFPDEFGRLHIVENKFFTEENNIWSWRGYSDFLPYRRYLAGEDLSEDFNSLRNRGVNLIRTFGSLPWKELGGDYTQERFNSDKLDNFFGLVADFGLRIEFVPFCYLWGKSDDRRKFCQRIFDIAKEHWNVLIELVNEPRVGDKPDPIDCLTGVNTHNVLTAYGYYPIEGQSHSGVKVKHYVTLHTERDDAWFRKARHCQEFQANKGVGVINDEPAKAIELGNSGSIAPHPGYNYSGGKSNVDEFIWHFAISYLWTPGATFHCEEGKWGHVPIPNTKQYEIFEAVSENVWKKIDASWQEGRYTGAHLSSCPVDGEGLEIDGDDIWTYASLHNSRSIAVRCANSHPVAIRGWKEVETWGPSNSMVRLEK